MVGVCGKAGLWVKRVREEGEVCRGKGGAASLCEEDWFSYRRGLSGSGAFLLMRGLGVVDIGCYRRGSSPVAASVKKRRRNYDFPRFLERRKCCEIGRM